MEGNHQVFISQCVILGKKRSNSMNAHENFIRIVYHFAEIDKNQNFQCHICMIQNFNKMSPDGAIGEKSRKQT